jgi:SAM-dependent methyltransferase
VLDVGCGEGALARQLARLVPYVVGIDHDAASIDLARRRSRLPADLPWEAAAVIAHRGYKLTRTYWEHPSPVVWPPPQTYPETRAVARQALPGVRYRRHLMWRYSLIWAKP